MPDPHSKASVLKTPDHTASRYWAPTVSPVPHMLPCSNSRRWRHHYRVTNTVNRGPGRWGTLGEVMRQRDTPTPYTQTAVDGLPRPWVKDMSFVWRPAAMGDSGFPSISLSVVACWLTTAGQQRLWGRRPEVHLQSPRFLGKSPTQPKAPYL